MEAFLPASQVDRRPVKDLSVWLGKKIPVMIIEMDTHKGNVVVSRRKLLEREAAIKRDATLKTMEVGKVLKGTVTSLTAFGAFVDVGGVEGLLRITDVSWGWVGKLSEVLKSGDVVDVKVLKFDPATGKIGLGRKQLLPKPWDTAEAQCPVGSIQKGKVTSITDFGAFVEVVPGIEGLVHQSEFSWKDRGVKPKEVVKLGDEVFVYVLSVSKAEEKMALSIKRAGENPWVETARQFRPRHSRHGVITNMLPVGAFLRLPVRHRRHDPPARFLVDKNLCPSQRIVDGGPRSGGGGVGSEPHGRKNVFGHQTADRGSLRRVFRWSGGGRKSFPLDRQRRVP
jgi:small subunit ribosomal protein S1